MFRSDICPSCHFDHLSLCSPKNVVHIAVCARLHDFTPSHTKGPTGGEKPEIFQLVFVFTLQCYSSSSKLNLTAGKRYFQGMLLWFKISELHYKIKMSPTQHKCAAGLQQPPLNYTHALGEWVHGCIWNVILFFWPGPVGSWGAALKLTCPIISNQWLLQRRKSPDLLFFHIQRSKM